MRRSLPVYCVIALLITGCSPAAETLLAPHDVSVPLAEPDTTEEDLRAPLDRYWEGAVPEPPGDDEPLTYKDYVSFSLNRWCGECHLGPTDWDCSGASVCFVSFPEMMRAPGCCSEEDPFGTCEISPEIPGMTFGHCVLFRIEATKRGDTEAILLSKGQPIIVPDEEIEMIKRWLNEGQPFE